MKTAFLTISAIFLLSCAELSDQAKTDKQNEDRVQKLQSVIIEDGIVIILGRSDPKNVLRWKIRKS